MVLTRKLLEENTKILAKENDRVRLTILEALFIRDLQPSINRQIEVPTLLPSMKPLPWTRPPADTRTFDHTDPPGRTENGAPLRRSARIAQRTPGRTENGAPLRRSARITQRARVT